MLVESCEVIMLGGSCEVMMLGFPVTVFGASIILVGSVTLSDEGIIDEGIILECTGGAGADMIVLEGAGAGITGMI